MPVLAAGATPSGLAGASTPPWIHVELHAGSGGCKLVVCPVRPWGRIFRPRRRRRGFAPGHFGHLRRSDGQPVDRPEQNVTPDQHHGDGSTRDGVSGQPADRAGDVAALWLLTLLPACDFEQLVVGRSLLLVAQYGVGADDPPESLCSFRVAGIDVGMACLRGLTECSSETVRVVVRKRPQQIVKSCHYYSLKCRCYSIKLTISVDAPIKAQPAENPRREKREGMEWQNQD